MVDDELPAALEEVGYKGEEIIIETTVACLALDKPMSEAIAAMWKDVGVEVMEYSVRAQKSRERGFKGLWWGDPTSTLGDPDGMMWRLQGMTKVFLKNLPWLPVIQPYEDYGLQKYVEFTPNPNQQFEVRRFNFKFRRA